MGDREQFWQTHVDACRMSGITQRAYCERHGIAPKTFRKWRARLAGAAYVIAAESEPHGGEVKGGARELMLLKNPEWGMAPPGSWSSNSVSQKLWRLPPWRPGSTRRLRSQPDPTGRKLSAVPVASGSAPQLQGGTHRLLPATRAAPGAASRTVA